MHGSRDERWQAFLRHVQHAPGQLDPSVREAVFAAAAGGKESEVPADLAPFVETVAKHAYRTTDADVDRLRDAGYSEDQIFEAVVVAAAGAASLRLDAFQRAVEGA